MKSKNKDERRQATSFCWFFSSKKETYQENHHLSFPYASSPEMQDTYLDYMPQTDITTHSKIQKCNSKPNYQSLKNTKRTHL